MDQIRWMNWVVEVDVEQTKDFYTKDMERCHCLYCENYMEASKLLDSSLVKLFFTLGINPSKPSHLSEFGERRDGLRLYVGSYHIVGKLVKGELCTDSEWNDATTAKLDNFTFAFGKDVMFLHDEFPHPVLQLEFEARLPWVLNEKPEEE
ncbi:hypothetical protein [Bacillus sp. MRMR6]|uniref:hypothetical protein n=1 Tax=Bacillus sp. MRMR6 TaxID=1928617 RepID=UPI000951E62C|nr:hypothetical protein [Bacillus sp. MRMR6]OLS33358.1 hypothetical protein BTR25_26365 [Bacillus sp. MRMR6]